MAAPQYDIPRAMAMAGWLVLWAGAAPPAAVAQKTDLVVLDNGDRITGEIKRLYAGQLEYSTDDVGRIYIEWDKIARVMSQDYFEVQLASGRKYYGRLDPAGQDKQVVVARTSADTLALLDVVAIVPISERFVNRLKAYLDLGFSLAKANAATTLNLSSEVTYRGTKWGSGISYSSYLQGQSGTTTTTRNTLLLSADRFFADRWRAGGLLQFDQNDELALDLRVTAGGEVGRAHLTGSSELNTGVGLVVTREQFVDSTGAPLPSQDNLEGTLTLYYDAFRYDTPKLDLSTALTVYPSISSPGRVRIALTGRVKYELFHDFFAGINFTDNFDSRPPAGAEKNDYVTSLTIGWSYRR